jgi:hypothetical protein
MGLIAKPVLSTIPLDFAKALDHVTLSPENDKLLY